MNKKQIVASLNKIANEMEKTNFKGYRNRLTIESKKR